MHTRDALAAVIAALTADIPPRRSGWIIKMMIMINSGWVAGGCNDASLMRKININYFL